MLDKNHVSCFKQRWRFAGTPRSTYASAYHKPELLATAPNQLWSWDITKLRGPVKWNYFYLDVFSRYVVGWMIAPRETAALATKLIEETAAFQFRSS